MSQKKSTLKQTFEKGKKDKKSTIEAEDFEKLLKKAVSTKPFSPQPPKQPGKAKDQT